ncbi:hypothetical protein VUJ46_01320 [Chryseobacterium sp. MYb264]|uniref:hypothetical protein n=1 Tax=Chryseobacterium sp. MYb264 TaxID=2745153 RepID=UPI002E0D69FD|nr:hypothetical protein VUJ46_01320 [Chryseobacterium sp. MYb264]
MKKSIPYSFIVLLLLTGCKDFKKSIADTLSDPGDPAKVSQKEDTLSTSSKSVAATKEHLELPEYKDELPISIASDPGLLEDAEKKLRALPEFKGHAINIYEFIYFYGNGQIIVKIQNPGNPKYVDQYTFDEGQWQKPKPVALSKYTVVKDDIVSLDKVPFINANRVFKIVEQKKREIGSKDVTFTIYSGVGRKKVEWFPNAIQNERSVYSIDFNEDGTLRSFEQK